MTLIFEFFSVIFFAPFGRRRLGTNPQPPELISRTMLRLRRYYYGAVTLVDTVNAPGYRSPTSTDWKAVTRITPMDERMNGLTSNSSTPHSPITTWE